LRRRHFEPLYTARGANVTKSSAAERAALRSKLHAFCPAGGEKLICAAFGTELLLQPGKCDSLSINRQDCSIRSYDPQDGNVEVGEMLLLTVCVFLSPFLTAVHVRECQLFVGQHATRHDPEPEDVSEFFFVDVLY
jgi:hypothetical protein